MIGIICIETEWQITTHRNRRTLNTEPLMQYIHEMYKVPYIYRRVATLEELKYYLSQFKKKEYDKFKILYFNFHGATHSISLEGEKENLSLDSLLENGGSVFENRFIHFSSCRTFLGTDTVAKEFKEKSGAVMVSGYTKSVPVDLSALHDIALISEFLNFTQKSSVLNRLKKNFETLEKSLGFKAF